MSTLESSLLDALTMKFTRHDNEKVIAVGPVPVFCWNAHATGMSKLIKAGKQSLVWRVGRVGDVGLNGFAVVGRTQAFNGGARGWPF